jgi:hypothetical protein
VWIDENLVDAIRRADGDARRNGNAIAHDGYGSDCGRGRLWKGGLRGEA